MPHDDQVNQDQSRDHRGEGRREASHDREDHHDDREPPGPAAQVRSPTPTPIQMRPNTSTIAPITPAAKPNARGSPTPTRISGATMKRSPRPTIRTPRRIVSTARSVTPIGRDGGG